MKKVIFLTITVVLSMLIFTACNNESKEEADEKNEGATTAMKKDTGTSVVSTTPSSTSNYSAANLPLGVKEFVSKNYDGYKIVSADSDPLCGGGPAVDVAIKKTGAPTFSLIFKPDGSYVQQEEDVDLSTAPDKIRTSLKTQFGKYNAGGQIEKLILADKSIQYMVDLTNGKKTKEVIFTAEGNIVCEN